MTRLFTGIAAALAVATLAGLAILWPGEIDSQLASGIAVESLGAEVERVEESTCAGFQAQRCQLASVRLKEGADTGTLVQIQLGGGGFDPDVDPGDRGVPCPPGVL